MDVLSLGIDCFFWSGDMEFSVNTTNLEVCESFNSVEKNDSQGKAEKVLPTQTSDKESMTENHTSPQTSDKESMTESHMSPQTSDKESMIETENSKFCLCKSESMCEREIFYVNPYSNLDVGRFFQDMHCLYKEGLHRDFILCAGTRTFPVHKSILAARSPVFKAMFTTPLKEKDGKVLDIPDIDADTLHRMLLFVYTNEVRDLEWEDAINLYFAADKYNIGDLRRISCSVLKSKLSVSNVCKILVHADLHGDQDLKSSVMEFIAGHDDDIIGTEDWKMFQKNHISLSMEIFRVLYINMKKRVV